MTNFEKIKSMSVEEMAKFIDNPIIDCKRCVYYEDGECCDLNRDGCIVGIRKWLESEADNE